MWAWFCELSAARQSNGYSIGPISFSDIDAWSRLTRSDPTPWEVALIRRIDAAIIPVLNGRSSRPTNAVSVNNVEGVAALFAGFKAKAKEKFKKNG